MSNKWDVKPFWGRRWPFLGQKAAQDDKRWPFLGLQTLPHVPKCSVKVPYTGGDVMAPRWCPRASKGARSTCSGSTPLGWAQPKHPGWKCPSSSLVQRLDQSLSYLYPWWGPNNHLMGSSAPWRFELIISPCVPIHWYLSVGHGPAHQKLRPPWAH